MESQVFSKSAVRVALSCASKVQGRYAFNGVRVEPGRMIATDGHRLVIVERSDVPEGKPAEDACQLVDREALDKARKGAKVETVTVNGSCEARDHFNRLLATFPAEPMEGDFPDWTAVLPKASDMEGSVTVKLSPELLGGILATLGNAVGGFVAIEVPAPSKRPEGKGQVCKPVRITATLPDDSKVTAILMPITS